MYADEAINRAKEIDSKLKEGKAGKLAGLVIALKDVLCHKDHAVHAGSKILTSFVSLYNATAVERLLNEDAIIIGRTNCDEFAMGSSNENCAYGNVLNGIDESRVPGGSSGGSAVAVQMDMCLASLGTDTGGSIRQPASFCGVIGLKPTYGRISRYGLIAYASSFDQIGPFTHSVEDAALLVEVMSGADEFDSTASTHAVDSYSTFEKEKKKYRIAYIPEVNNHEKVDPEIRKKVNELLEQLKNEGHEVTPVSFDMIDQLVPAYYVLTTAEASSNLSRFDGIRYGFKSENAVDLDSTYKKNRSEGFGKEVKRRIMLGTFVLSAGYFDAYYSRGQKVRRLIHEKTQAIFSNHDFIITPTTPTTAFKLGEKSNDPIEMYLADIFTVHAPLAGIPGISLPMGKHENGLPFGVQVMANKYEEKKMFSFSDYLMKNFS